MLSVAPVLTRYCRHLNCGHVISSDTRLWHPCLTTPFFISHWHCLHLQWDNASCQRGQKNGDNGGGSVSGTTSYRKTSRESWFAFRDVWLLWCCKTSHSLTIEKLIKFWSDARMLSSKFRGLWSQYLKIRRLIWTLKWATGGNCFVLHGMSDN